MLFLLSALACKTENVGDLTCQSRLTGDITDGQGFGIADARVTVLGTGETAMTDADGVFLLEGLDPDLEYRLRIDAEGYAPTYAEAAAGCWETGSTSARLSPVDAIATFDAATGGQIATDNVEVDFAANSVVDASGAAYTGTVTVTVAWIDPSTAEVWEGPGDLTGIGINTETGAEERQLMVSYGMADISLYDDAGEPLQLADGETASVTMDIAQEHLPEAVVLEDGATQSLWWYDGETGAWIEEGVATITDEGTRATFEASHFTWWNVDDGRVAYCAEGVVVDMLGFPIRNAQVTCTAFAPPDFGDDDGDGGDGGDRILNPDADSINITYTDANGAYECEVWAGSTAEFDAQITVNGTTYSANSGVLPIMGTTDSMDICEPIPTLQIEVCRESGIVMVDDLVVTNSAMTDVDADQAKAWFWEPVGNPAQCANPWEAIPLDSCVVAQPDEFPEEFAATFRDRDWGLDRHTRSAGDFVELSNGRGSWRMEQTTIGGDPVYLWDTLSVDGTELEQTPIDVRGGDTMRATAPGSADAYFGPIQDEAWVGMPSGVSLTNVPADGVYKESTSGVTLAFNGQNNADHLFVFVTTAPDEAGLMCRYRDDGSVTLSASDLGELSDDWGSIAVYRPEIGWVAGPDGLPIRAQGLAGEIVGVNLK